MFLPSLRLPRLCDQWTRFSEAGATRLVQAEGTRRERRQAANDAFEALQPLLVGGLAVVIEAPKPLFRAPAFRCSDWFNRRNPICAPGLTMPRDDMRAYRKPVLDDLVELAGRHPGMSIWDPLETLCPTSTCQAVVDGAPLFFDGDHLSGHGNEVLYPSFAAHVTRAHAASMASANKE